MKTDAAAEMPCTAVVIDNPDTEMKLQIRSFHVRRRTKKRARFREIACQHAAASAPVLAVRTEQAPKP
jgi:hypothetical protein